VEAELRKFRCATKYTLLFSIAVFINICLTAQISLCLLMLGLSQRHGRLWVATDFMC